MHMDDLEEFGKATWLFFAMLVQEAWSLIPAVLTPILTFFGFVVEDKALRIVLWTGAGISLLIAVLVVFYKLRKDYIKLKKEKDEQEWNTIRQHKMQLREPYLRDIPDTLAKMKGCIDRLVAETANQIDMDKPSLGKAIMEIINYVDDLPPFSVPQSIRVLR
jgi:hypothetical protein